MKLTKTVFLLFSCLLLVSCGKSLQEKNLFIDELRGQPPEKIYEQAEASFKNKDYHEALKTYEALNSLYPFSQYAASVLLQLMHCYYHDSKMEDVIRLSEKYMLLYPQSEQIETVWYIRTKAYFYRGYDSVLSFLKLDRSQRDTSLLPEAIQELKTFLKFFPNSVYQEKVEKRIQLGQELLATYKYRIADYYFKKKAYLATLNRANELIKQYPDTAAAAQAISLKMDATQQLGLNEPISHK